MTAHTIKAVAQRLRAAARFVIAYWRLRRGANLKLHLGCGQNHFAGFINIDHNYSRATDFICDISRLPCKDGSVERIETYHVIEHIPRATVEAVLAEWLRVLRPGGTLVLECPNLEGAVREWLAGDDSRLGSIFGWQRFPGDTHHWGYTASSLSHLLRTVGFKQARSLEPQDYHAQSEPCIRVEGLA